MRVFCLVRSLMLLSLPLGTAAATAAESSSARLLARASAQVYTRPDSALWLARRAEQLARATRDRPQQGSAWNVMGVVHYSRDAYRPALHAFTRALRLFEQTGDSAKQADLLTNLGSLSLTMDLQESSYQYFQRGMRITLALHPDSTGLTFPMRGSGVALAALNRLPEALDRYRLTLHLDRRAHDLSGEAQTMSYIGAVYVKQKRFREAIATLEAVQRMGTESPDGLIDLEVLQGLGDAYRGLGQWTKAAAYYQKRIRAEPDMPSNLYDSFKRLADVQHRAGDYRAAYKSLNRYVGIADSLNDEESTRRTQELETRYRTREQQQQIQVQQLTIARKNQLAVFGFGAGGLALLAAGALGLLFVQRTRANRRLSAANEAISRAMAEKETLLAEKTGLLAEKEMLMQEVHHRVKNNLQLVSGLLGWQAEAEPAAAAALNQSRARLHSMALIHEHLYRADDLARVRLDEYLGQLLRTLAAAHANPYQSIQLTTDLMPLTVDAKEAIPLGLITNELVLNAYKHAFRGQPAGHLHVRLTGTNAADDRRFRLMVEDDGIGMAGAGTQPAAPAPSLGMQLVRMMTKQLKAGLMTEVNPPTGTRFVLARDE